MGLKNDSNHLIVVVFDQMLAGDLLRFLNIIRSQYFYLMLNFNIR